MDLETKVKWAQREDKNSDPEEFYLENYPGVPRGTLSRLDSGLYQMLRRRGKLTITTDKHKNKGRIRSRYGEDPVAYYNENHNNVGREDLKVVDRALYDRIMQLGLLNEIPNRKDIISKDPYGYYKKHFLGLSKNQLKQKKRILYDLLEENGDLEKVLPVPKGRPKRHGDDALAYYKEHYQGVSRGRLARLDQTLYKRLNREGLLNSVPLARDLRI